MDREWLDVPFDEKDWAKEQGAKWDWAEKRWYAPEANMAALDRWRAKPPIPSILIGEDRNFGSGLFVDLVPQSAWFTNVRSCVSPVDWERIRRMVVSRAGRACEICGSGPDPTRQLWLEAHERWEYDGARRTQILRRLICLCTPCHTATHMGLASIQGKADEAMAHLAQVNGWSEEEAIAHANNAFDVWGRRSQVEWKLDISMLDNIGVALPKPPDRSQRKVEADCRITEIRSRDESGQEIDGNGDSQSDPRGLQRDSDKELVGKVVNIELARKRRFRPFQRKNK